jgi:hypothetical protein
MRRPGRDVSPAFRASAVGVVQDAMEGVVVERRMKMEDFIKRDLPHLLEAAALFAARFVLRNTQCSRVPLGLGHESLTHLLAVGTFELQIDEAGAEKAKHPALLNYVRGDDPLATRTGDLYLRAHP